MRSFLTSRILIWFCKHLPNSKSGFSDRPAFLFVNRLHCRNYTSRFGAQLETLAEFVRILARKRQRSLEKHKNLRAL